MSELNVEGMALAPGVVDTIVSIAVSEVEGVACVGSAGAQGRGIRAVVDATRDLLVNVLPYKPFLIKPNNHELSEITGVRLTNDKEIAAAALLMQD